jgi:hypothetical protein
MQGIVQRAPTRVPEIYIEDLLRRTAVGHNDTDGEFAAGNYIAEANRDGGEVSGAIMQLEGVHPNLAVAQIWQLLSAPSHGNSLSRTERQAIVYLSNTWPELRVYAFDYDLDIGAVKTMISIYKLRKELPAVFVNNAAYYGLGTRDEFETKIPELKALKDAQEFQGWHV